MLFQGLSLVNPLRFGGSLGRDQATGRGVFYTAQKAVEHLGIKLDGAKVVVQGFENAGSVVGMLFEKAGAKVIAVSDSKGGVYNEKGLEIMKLIEHKSKTGSVIGFPNSESMNSDELLALECDILVPAALENAIHEGNAGKINAKIIAEAANGPTTPEADAILEDKGVFVIPDILCNAGGVTVSYFEWVQDEQHLFWDEGQIYGMLEKIMKRAFDEVLNIHLRNKVSMRIAAYMLGISRVAEAVKLRGLYP